MFRFFFLFLFLPVRILYYLWICIRLFFLRKKSIYELELPVQFETSDKPFFVRKFQGKEPTNTRLEILDLLKTISESKRIKKLKIFAPPLEWTLSEFFEIREVLESIKNKGILIQIFATEGGVGTLLLFSAANECFVGKESEFHIVLPSAEPIFFGNFLKFWGVEVQAFASGPYKSFAETFTRGDFTKEARKNLSALIENLQDKILTALTKGNDNLKTLYYHPILTADMLKSNGVVTDIISKDKFFDKESNPLPVNFPYLERAKREFKLFPKRREQILILSLDGGISGGDYQNKSRESGRIDAHSLIPTLTSITSDPKIKAVILEISSPGGSAFYSEQIHQSIVSLKEKKPVHAYFKDTVASGGYYLGSAVDHITASPVCITGSIGAVMVRANVQKLYKKFKLNKEAVGFYPFRDLHSEFSPLRKESVQYLQKEIKRIESVFYNRVSEGRKIPIEEMPKIGMGRVYLPTTENRIVDKLGGLLDAIEVLKKELNLTSVKLVEELPSYNFKNKIPILGSLGLELRELESINQIVFKNHFKIQWRNTR
ncbi:S49 family peptidase [Leptospira sp. 96542]|nr:S49 family peptidase [Leptospira sp. 96542]